MTECKVHVNKTWLAQTFTNPGAQLEKGIQDLTLFSPNSLVKINFVNKFGEIKSNLPFSPNSSLSPSIFVNLLGAMSRLFYCAILGFFQISAFSSVSRKTVNLSFSLLAVFLDISQTVTLTLLTVLNT